MKRVLVTGGAGFIGSHTVDLLLDQGLHVIVFDNLATGKLSHLNLFHPNFQIFQKDILDYATLVKEMSRCDAVLHLAAISSVSQSIEDPIQSLKINTLGFLNVLQAIREINRPIRLVYASSAAVYGNIEELPCRDDIPLIANVLSPYALEKANNERYAELYASLFGIRSLGLRYFNVYGSRQDPKSHYSGVISKFIYQYQKQEPITIFGDGKQSRDFIYVSDVARANLAALKSDFCGVLNIGTGKPESLLNLVHYLEKMGTEPVKIEFTAPRPGDIQQSYASTEKAKMNLKFEYEIPLEKGIQTLVEKVAKEGMISNS